MFINALRTKILQFTLVLILLTHILNINGDIHVEGDEIVIDVGIRLKGGKRDALIADLIAQERNLLNAGHVDGVNLFHFHIRRKRHHRSKRAIDETIEALKRDERIEDVLVGEPLYREKREFLTDEQMIDLYKKFQQKNDREKTRKFEYIDADINIDKFNLQMSFNDALYGKQWYLENKGQLNTPADHDINVTPVWLAGYSGEGISICIVDDGVDHPHPDLTDHYRSDLSYDLNNLTDPDHDPLPGTYDDQNNHGTRCAGTAVGKADNKICGVGVAHRADLAAIRVLDGPVTTLLEARALTMYANKTHIKSASWGPTDDGTKMEAPGSLVNAALNYGIKYGRYGKGLLYVWAAGNGGAASDDCGADGYASHQNIISIGSINHLGKTTYFDEACPSTMAVAYTGGQHTTALTEERLSVGVVTADVGGKCTTSFFGTSAAAPVAAGAFALLLEANPELGYRDVMHIIARTARIPNLSETDDWIINGAGFHVSDKFGFGVLDVGQMIALAQNWINVDVRHECYFEAENAVRELEIGGVVEVSIDVTECENVESIEHVVANVSYIFHRRGDVKVILISPSQTRSEMLSYRDNDATDKGIKYFPFLSVHHWGESPIGRWTLRIETREPQTSESRKSAVTYTGLSELSHFGLRIYGSSTPKENNDNNNNERHKRERQMAFAPTAQQLENLYQRELSRRGSPNIIQKREYENMLKQRELKKQRKDFDPDRSIVGSFRRFFGF